MSEPLVTEEELDAMERLAGQATGCDRWWRLCQELRRLQPAAAEERGRVLAYLLTEAKRLNRIEGCPSSVRRTVRRLIGVFERGDHLT